MNFLADMELRPAGTTLGRFGDVGNYEKGNCAWMTKAQQGAAMQKKGSKKGSRHPKHKLYTSEVREIRARVAAGESQAALAREFGVADSTMWTLVRGRSWQHVRG